MPVKELEKRKTELEQKLKYLRRKLDKPVTTIGLKMIGKIVLYRNRVENDEYSFKLDEDISIGWDQCRNFLIGEVYPVLSVYCEGRVMSSPQLGSLGAMACNAFRKTFLKTQDEYIKHKDIIDREYAGFDKMEAELREIKDALEKDDVTRESNERLRKMQRFFGEYGGK